MDFDLTVTRYDAGSPFNVALGSNRVAINFQENENDEKVPLLVARYIIILLFGEKNVLTSFIFRAGSPSLVVMRGDQEGT